ncbi:MAG: HRDC domain-containing protein [Victivallales bacterium]|nr:HRDC domain-containing protein [Victivallales bacterium]
METPFFTKTEELEGFCAEALRQKMIGIDTEFVWSRTYYPLLGLVQLAWDEEHCALVDPIAIQETSPLKALLEAPNVVKIFHEAGSDLPILRRWTGALPRNVVDTRYAAGFCGLTTKVSLAKLLAIEFGLVLPKTETRSDWTQRPLTTAQLEYAGDDATHLPRLYTRLAEKIDALGNTDFFQDEMRCYESEEFYRETDVNEAWRRLEHIPGIRYGQQDLAILRVLAAWRETLARQQNITKNRILRDEQLIHLAVHRVKDKKQMADTYQIPWQCVKNYGEQIAQLIAQAEQLPISEWPSMPHSYFGVDQRMVKQRADRVLSLARKRAEPRGIDPTLVASRREAEHLALAASHKEENIQSPLLTGWRHQLLGPALEEICQDFRNKPL